MRDLSALVTTATEAEEGKMFWFIELQFDVTQRYTDADVDLYIPQDIYDSWKFKNSSDGFTTSNATITENSNSITLIATTTDPILRKSSISFSGADYPIINIRMKRLLGAGWQGAIFYTTSGHGESSSYNKYFSEPSNFSEYQDIKIDMSNLTNGGTDWTDNTITGIRFDFANSAGNNFEIDFINVSSDVNKFETMPFEIGKIGYSAKSSVDKLKIDIQNVDLTMSSTSLNEDIMNKWGLVYIGFYDGDNKLISEPIKVFEGLVSTWNLTEMRASITLVNEFIFWNKKVMRKHQGTCRWAFKGTECGYSGIESWCDQSFNRCHTLNNRDNFGGFRFLPDLEEKKVFWGRST